MGPLVLLASAVPQRRLSAPIDIEGQDLERGRIQQPAPREQPAQSRMLLQRCTGNVICSTRSSRCCMPRRSSRSGCWPCPRGGYVGLYAQIRYALPIDETSPPHARVPIAAVLALRQPPYELVSFSPLEDSGVAGILLYIGAL